MSETEQTAVQPMSRLAVADWLVETLRLTAFPQDGTPVDHETWWAEVFGEAPDETSEELRRGRSTTRATYGAGELVLQILPGRVDWLLTAGGPDDGEMPTVGSYIQNLGAFLEFAHRWFALEECPVLNRLAFGAILHHPVQDRETGYRQLQPYLPAVELDPLNSSDFQYRINRPRDSRTQIPALRINRLSAWSVAAFRHAVLYVGMEPVTPLAGPPSYSCRIELDINTAPDPDITLGREELPFVFDELVGLAREIIEEGDIP
jgi:hypothetical protein